MEIARGLESPHKSTVAAHCHSVDSVHQHSAALTDEYLMNNACGGCSECFALLFKRHYSTVFAISFKILRDRTESEDVGQEVFLSIFQKREQYDPARGSVRGWILGFAHLKALVRRRYLRTRNLYAVDEIASLDEIRLHPSWEFHGMGAPDWIETVERGLGSLSASQRRAIELVNFEGYTLQETSEILGEGLSNIKNHYYRGMRALRLFLVEACQVRQASNSQARSALDAGPVWPLAAQRTPRAGSVS